MKRQKPSHSKMLEKQEIKMNSFPVLLRERKSKIRFPTGHSQQEPLLGWRRPDRFSPSYKPREKAVRRSHRGPSSAAAVACQSPERVTGDDAAVGRDPSRVRTLPVTQAPGAGRHVGAGLRWGEEQARPGVCLAQPPLSPRRVCS